MIAQPIPCADVVSQLWDWLDNELPRERWTAIQQHLASCTGCSGHMAFARSFLDRVRSDEPEAPENIEALRAKIRAALRPPS